MQTRFGISPQLFSLIFAVNSGGIVTAEQVSRLLVGRVPQRTLFIAS